MKRSIKKIVVPTDPRYPKAMDRRRFLGVGAATLGALFVGSRSAGAGEVETRTESLLFDQGYVLNIEYEVGDEEVVRQALEGVRPAVQEVLDRVVNGPKLHDDAERAAIESELTKVVADALSPTAVVKLSLDHDCNEVCGRKKLGIKGKRKMPDSF